MNSKIIALVTLAVLGGGGYYVQKHPENPVHKFVASKLALDDGYDDEGNNEYDNDPQSQSPHDDGGDYFILARDVDSADQCSSQEDFNPDNMTCEAECDNDADCNALEKEIGNELDGWADAISSPSEPRVERDPEKSAPTQAQTLAEYKVSPGEKITLTRGKDDSEYNQIWKLFASISPNAISDRSIEKYMIYSDGNDDTIAYVERQDTDKYLIAVNIAQYSKDAPKERVATLVHEFAHILSLDIKQVNAYGEATTCKTIFIDGDGCLLSGAYLQNFISTFWPASDRAAAAAQKDVWAKGKFVSEYAASNEVEDFAETFATFVLRQKNESPATIADKKVASLYQNADLVAHRDAIRKELGSLVYSLKVSPKK